MTGPPHLGPEVGGAVDCGGSTGAELRVPIEALRDSTVWVRTQNCDDVEGEVVLRVCAEVEAYWDADGVVSGEGTTTLRGGAGAGGLTVSLSAAVLAPGEAAVVSVEAASGAPLDDGDLVDLALGPAAADAGVLRWAYAGGAEEGPTLSGVPGSALRDGAVRYVVNAYSAGGPPPALTTEPPALDGQTTAPPPGPGAPLHRLGGVGVGVSASLSAEPEATGDGEVVVLPYGVRLDVGPDPSRVGDELAATVEVVSAVRSPRAYEVPVDWVAALAATAGNVFVCAQDLFRDPDTGASAYPASFPALWYGRSEVADADCAAFRFPGWSPVGAHTTALRYPAPLGPGGPEGPFRPFVYGGLAVERADGSWAWAAGVGGGPLVEAQALEVFAAADRAVTLEVAVSEDEVWPFVPTYGACSGVSRKCRGAYDFDAVDPTVDEVVVRLTEDSVPVEGVAVQIEAEWVEGSGGHSHDGSGDREPPRSKMGLFTRTDGRTSTAAVDGVTDAAGEVRVSYRAPEFGGRVELRATANYGDEAQEASAAVEVRVPSLELLPARPDLYYRIGGTRDHHGPREVAGVSIGDSDDNHYAIPAVNRKLAEIAAAWLAISESHTKIAVNDLSLPNGGRFRVNTRNWGGDSPRAHQFHRVGRDADVRTRRWGETGAVRLYPQPDGRWTNPDFEDIVWEAGGHAEIHDPNNRNNEHYHIYFYGPLDTP